MLASRPKVNVSPDGSTKEVYWWPAIIRNTKCIPRSRPQMLYYVLLNYMNSSIGYATVFIFIPYYNNTLQLRLQNQVSR
jgi:hypothetical protein